jgi:hypothetical protein
VQLQPLRQPGRVDRKAAVYASEIARLRRTGYTYEAIREALAAVGVELSTSALRREVRRLEMRPASALPEAPPAEPAVVKTPSVSSIPQPHAAAPVRGRSRDIAESFFNAHFSHPLIQTTPEAP